MLKKRKMSHKFFFINRERSLRLLLLFPRLLLARLFLPDTKTPSATLLFHRFITDFLPTMNPPMNS